MYTGLEIYFTKPLSVLYNSGSTILDSETEELFSQRWQTGRPSSLDSGRDDFWWNFRSPFVSREMVCMNPVVLNPNLEVPINSLVVGNRKGWVTTEVLRCLIPFYLDLFITFMFITFCIITPSYFGTHKFDKKN